MNWTHLLRSAALIGALAGTAFAEQIDGILMTTMCAAKAVKEGGDAAVKHERTCNLKPNCAKTGFGVLTPDNRFFQFDQAGNEKALKALQESAKKDDMKVVVTGDVQGNKIAVSNLKLEN